MFLRVVKVTNTVWSVSFVQNCLKLSSDTLSYVAWKVSRVTFGWIHRYVIIYITTLFAAHNYGFMYVYRLYNFKHWQRTPPPPYNMMKVLCSNFCTCFQKRITSKSKGLSVIVTLLESRPEMSSGLARLPCAVMFEFPLPNLYVTLSSTIRALRWTRS
jgi:hypothetical protein